MRLLTPAVAALSVSIAFAGDQTLLGKRLQVKDPKPGIDATKRKIVGQGVGAGGATNTIVGDPTATGAMLTITAAGTTPSTQTYTMPASFWTATSGGFKYKDADLTAGR